MLVHFRQIVVWSILGMGLLTVTPLMADQAQMKATLVKIVNQLEAIKPLISQAKAEQSANPRIKIHFDRWVDANGITHPGLRQDIEGIQAALIQAINARNNGPRIYKPITGDFTGQQHG